MAGISDELIAWYTKHKRDLPWRKTNNPYFIWLSEVILQQTRVQQGLPYYEKFTEKYPTIHQLAAAKEIDILKLWQGLGYYSRARNLLKTAQKVTEIYGNQFPKTYTELIQLPGIGPYTAAAIASFADNEKVAVVDGNVYRVLARLFGIYTPIDSSEGKKEFQSLANELLGNPSSAHNQAIMEFGAIVCKPKLPLCQVCVLAMHCVAKKNNASAELPVKGKKNEIKTRFLNYLVLFDGAKHYLKQRTETDIWQGLYDFPLVESINELTEPEAVMEQEQFIQWKLQTPVFLRKSEKYKHLLTHREIQATFWEFSVTEIKNKKNLIGVTLHEHITYPIPKLIDNYLNDRFKNQ